ALRWLVQQPRVLAIPKAASPAHLAANLDVFDFALSGEEMARVASAVRALDDGDVRAFGALVHASHRSTATHYAVSCDELDVITDLACAQPSTFGARLTGAGFGGCAIALIEPGTADAVVEPVRQGFAARFGVEPGFRVLHAGPGPRELEA
ncbi:MAG: aldo/keto reductase, partial [Planctomycetota bacterium]